MDAQTSEWLTVGEAAHHARCGKSPIYSGRRELRFLAAWIDA
jgi:hypothetical protein